MKTALDWYSQELDILIIKLGFKSISKVEYLKEKKELLIKAKEMEKNCFVEKIILKDGYRACCGKEITEDAAEQYCKDVWLKT